MEAIIIIVVAAIIVLVSKAVQPTAGAVRDSAGKTNVCRGLGKVACIGEVHSSATTQLLMMIIGREKTKASRST